MRMRLTKTPSLGMAVGKWQGITVGEDVIGCSADIERLYYEKKGPGPFSMYEFTNWEYDNDKEIRDRYQQAVSSYGKFPENGSFSNWWEYSKSDWVGVDQWKNIYFEKECLELRWVKPAEVLAIIL